MYMPYIMYGIYWRYLWFVLAEMDPLKLYVTGFDKTISVAALKKLFPTATTVTLPMRKKTGQPLGWANWTANERNLGYTRYSWFKLNLMPISYCWLKKEPRNDMLFFYIGCSILLHLYKLLEVIELAIKWRQRLRVLMPHYDNINASPWLVHLNL